MISLCKQLFWEINNNQIRIVDILCAECILEASDDECMQCSYSSWNKGKTSCGALLIIW